MELLSRVSIREPESGLGELWEAACKLYREPAVRAGLGFSGPLRDFFSNLIDATPRSQLIERLPALFRLPVTFEADFGVAFTDRWPDPATMATQRLDSSCWQRPPLWLADVKRRLIDLARIGAPQARRPAFIRLLKLNELGILSMSDGRALAQIFWGPTATTPGLPATRGSTITS